MAGRLPTTTMLEVFDAVMRYGGFLKASKGLNVSAPAVSYTIRSLEQVLKVELFERRPDGIRPTRHAEDFVVEARYIIDRLRDMTERAQSQSRGDHTLRILTSQAFASLWLIPRMSDLMGQFPRWHFEVISWTGGQVEQANERAAGIDVEIRWADESAATGNEMRVVAQDFGIPVCSPRYLQRLGGSFSSENAATATVINALNWPGTWQRWLTHALGHDVALRDTIDLQTTSLCVQAAISGVGIAMAHGPLIQRELANGALCLAHPQSLPLDQCYVAIKHRADSRDIFDQFAGWVRLNMVGRTR